MTQPLADSCAAANADILGVALLDFINGDSSGLITSHCSDGEVLNLPVSLFFRGPEEFPRLEQQALELCRGTVLDLGAGAGCHSLALQDRGLPVTAVDISPGAVEVLRRRGVRSVVRADVLELVCDPVDTLLMLMNGIGIVGALPQLETFLLRARQLVRPGGQILLDSLDIRGFLAARGSHEHGIYPGEVRYRWEYHGQLSEEFRWLYVDPITLCQYAARCGWRYPAVFIEENGDYLAQLQLPPSSGPDEPNSCAAP